MNDKKKRSPMIKNFHTLKYAAIALMAEMSGFVNLTTFNEQFRSRYKMTPSEFRRASKS